MFFGNAIEFLLLLLSVCLLWFMKIIVCRYTGYWCQYLFSANPHRCRFREFCFGLDLEALYFIGWTGIKLLGVVWLGDGRYIGFGGRFGVQFWWKWMRVQIYCNHLLYMRLGFFVWLGTFVVCVKDFSLESRLSRVNHSD